MSSFAERLARALADRLDAVVPTPPHVRADGDTVATYVGNEWWSTFLLGDVLESGGEEAEESSERIETVARALLGSVQDVVAVALREPWPRLASGEMALPDARADAARVHLWYGPDEHLAALSLEPLSLAELRRPPA